MTAARRRILLLALAATLAVPVAAAEQGQVEAEAAVYGGGAAFRGEALAFFLIDHVVDPDGLPLVGDQPASDADPVLGIEIAAAQFEAMVFERSQLVGADGLVLQSDPRDPSRPPERHVLEQVAGELVAQQSEFQLTILPVDPAAHVPFASRTQAGRLEPHDSLAMAPGTFRDATQNDIDDRDPAVSQFWSVRIDAPMVIHEDQAAQTDITFTGDMVVELQGATIQAQGSDGALLLETGVWQDEGLGTGVPLDQRAAWAQRTLFARVLLMDATVRITVQGGSPGLYVAAPSTESEHVSEVTLLGALGSVSSGGVVSQVDGERYTVPGEHTLAIGRRPERLDVDFAPTAAAVTPAGPASFPASTSSLLVGASAVFALAIAAGLGLARRLTHTPELAQVEAALEAQRFGRAARLAKRILRARPASEDAMLGRAIALSRGGRAGRAIAEIHDHLAKRDTSDGALHYVLGLAFLDLGRQEDARAALGEAVRRTPALQADVAARLGQQASSAPTPTPFREVHGYA